MICIFVITLYVDHDGRLNNISVASLSTRLLNNQLFVLFKSSFIVVIFKVLPKYIFVCFDLSAFSITIPDYRAHVWEKLYNSARFKEIRLSSKDKATRNGRVSKLQGLLISFKYSDNLLPPCFLTNTETHQTNWNHKRK